MDKKESRIKWEGKGLHKPLQSFSVFEPNGQLLYDDMYAFIAYLQKERNCSIATSGCKIISIRQFWKYLKIKAHLIENNIVEELKVLKQAKRIFNLEDSIRLLMSVEDSLRNYCSVYLNLNCTLHLVELTNLNVDQISAQSVTMIGKSDKKRQIYLTPAAKNAVNVWLIERNNYHPQDNALFSSNRGVRLTTRAIQIVIKNS